MASHLCGEKDFDWEGLNEAISLVANTMRRYGRIGVHEKEKYGTCRAYICFYSGGLFSLFRPGYVSMWGWPAWLRWCEFNIFDPMTRALRLHIPIYWRQKKVYNLAYQRALKKYPHLAEEIVEDAYYPELIDEWHKVMAQSWRRSNDYLSDRWHKTAEFYKRAVAIAEKFAPTEAAQIRKEYEEFETL